MSGQRGQLRRELALQIEAEMERGIHFWPEPSWNDAARSLLAAADSTGGATSGSLHGGDRPSTARGASPPSTPGRSPTAQDAGRRSIRPLRGTRPAAARPSGAAPQSRPSFGPPPLTSDRDRDWETQLEKLKQEALACTKCPLHQTRTNVVFNSGSGKVPLAFVSEAPGANEDAQAEAFVGRAGQLLTKIIAAIGIDRKDVYICNVLKCRPPGNRNPLPGEIQECTPYLRRQIELISPEAILAVGTFSAQFLTGKALPLGRLRGEVYSYLGVPVVATYHPAALLRNPGWTPATWDDLQLLRQVIDGA